MKNKKNSRLQLFNVFTALSIIFVFSPFQCTLPTDPSTVPPRNLAYPQSDYSIYVDEELNTTADVEYFVVKYTIDPPLPPGITIDSLTGKISGKTTVALPRTPFTIKATNKNGSTACVIFITVYSLPSFIIQPQNVNVTTTGSIVITAKATGGIAPLKYNWLKDGILMANKDSSTLVINPVSLSDAGVYRCSVKDVNGKTASSDPATCRIVTDVELPKITVAPGSRSALAGESVVLLGQATGTNLTYSWLKNDILIPGAIFPYYKIDSFSSSDAAKYTLIVRNEFGSDTSKPATYLTLIENTNEYFDLSISITGKGKIIYNSIYCSSDTSLKIQKNSSFTLNFLPDSGYKISTVMVDDQAKDSARLTGQYSFLQFNSKHKVTTSFTPLTVDSDIATLAVSVNTTDGGTVIAVPNKEKFKLNEKVKLTATAKDNYYFTGWSGSTEDIDPAKNDIEVTMDKNKSLKANFAKVGKFTITATASPLIGGTIMLLPDSASYSKNDIVKLIAIPAEGFKFSSWTGALSSQKDTIELTVDTNKNITAVFEALKVPDSFSLSVSLSDSIGGTVRLEPDRIKFLKDEKVKLTATAKEGYYFTGWSGNTEDIDPAKNDIEITMDKNKSIKANFALFGKFTITATASPAIGGTIKLQPEKASYSKGDTVKLIALPAEGYKFISWTGVSSSKETIEITVDTNKQLTANFELLVSTPDSFAITVSLSDSTAGTVLMDPNRVKFQKGETLKITASAKEGFYFAGWNGLTDTTMSKKDVISLTVNDNVTIKAMFLPHSNFTILRSFEPEKSGSIILLPDKESYQKGSTVKVIAKPANGYKFSQWSGANTSSNDTITLIIDTNLQIKAKFELIRWRLQIRTDPPANGGGNVSIDDTTLSLFDSLQLIATPNSANGYMFEEWQKTEGTGTVTFSNSKSTTTKIKISGGPAVVTAIFKEKPTYTVTIAPTIPGGSISINPSKENNTYFEGDEITISARADIGFSFTKWTGDISGTTSPYKVNVTKKLVINAVFTASETVGETIVKPGQNPSLNALIQKISGSSIVGAILAPEKGKYDNNTIEILGRVTIPIQRR